MDPGIPIEEMWDEPPRKCGAKPSISFWPMKRKRYLGRGKSQSGRSWDFHGGFSMIFYPRILWDEYGSCMVSFMMEIAVTFWFFMEGLQDQKKTSMDKLRIEWELPLVNQDEA